MKKGFLIISTLLLILNSCDKIEENNFIDGENQTNITEGVIKKILIEDFTGHRCQNCPQAAEELHAIQEAFPEQIIGIAMHAGEFATPYPSEANKYTTDFRTEEGTNIHDAFLASAYPTGMVNRNGGLNNSILNYTDWNGAVSNYVNIPAELKIDITENTAGDLLTINITITGILNSDFNHKLVVCLTEDNIIDWQKNGSKDIEDYEHNHVLRKIINGSWQGQNIGTITTDETITIEMSSNIDSEWVLENCNIVAYVYRENNYEIIQAEELKLN